MKTTKTTILIFLILGIFNCTSKKHVDQEQIQVPIETSGEINFGDTRLSYFIEGEGQPCFVCDDAEIEKNCLSDNLKDHFQFVFIDTRLLNSYDKPVDFSIVSLDTIVNDMETLRKKLGYDKIYVLGHSIIGLFALEYAKEYPNNTKGVIMINTPPHFKTNYMDIVNANWEEKASTERKEIFLNNQQRLKEINKDSISEPKWNYLYYEARVPMDWYDPQHDVSNIYPLMDYLEAGLNQLVAMMQDYEISKSDLKVPILLSLGKYDFIMPEIIWDDYKDKLETLTIFRFENSGHFPHVEEQELFDGYLLEWINDSDI